MNYVSSSFIVIPKNSSVNQFRNGRNTFEYSDNGMIIYPIGVAPVIQKGVGCIGIATISSFTVKQDMTTVRFEYRQLGNSPRDKSLAEAYYSLYRNNLNMNTAQDDYSSEDVFIPGAMTSPISAKKTGKIRDTSMRGFGRDDDDEEDSDDELGRIMHKLRGDNDDNPYL